MEKHQHLQLPLFQSGIERKKQQGGGKFSLPSGRNKAQFSEQAVLASKKLSENFFLRKKQFPHIDPRLIFEIEINQSLSASIFEKTLYSMEIQVLSVAEGKKGYWIVFSNDEDLKAFNQKLTTYGLSYGPNYDFFNAIESFREIPVEKKLGENLNRKPLGAEPEFVDLELWKIDDPQKNEKFIRQLKKSYTDPLEFSITDTLTTKSFVLLRVKLTKKILDKIVHLNEIARIDRPATVQFNPFEVMSPDIQEINFSKPDDHAMGILIIDSGIISNHPMLEKCVGGEENFQSGEAAHHDTVGHGTAVAGCAVYGDINDAIKAKQFSPSNWLFSAKVMYLESTFSGPHNAIYDPEKLLESQLKEAVESFLSKPEYHIKVVNISMGNVEEIWHKHYDHQLPLAALIDELAFTFPHVVFIVSTGNQYPLNIHRGIADLVDNYPCYLVENDNFKIINPATAALALTIGSIAREELTELECNGAESIKTTIAKANQPSPFTRTGLGINGMIKPELVEYGGNLICSDQHGRIIQDRGGKLALLNNKIINPVICFDIGSSFSTAKVAHLAGKIANQFPTKSANFIKNMLLVGSDYPFVPDKSFYNANDKRKSDQVHLSVSGYGLSQYDKAIHSFDNRAVLWAEGQIALDQIKIYSLQLPEVFFNETGMKKISITLTYTPETRATRGDSYLGNRMEFHLFHSVNPQILREKYGSFDSKISEIGVPEDVKKYEIDFFPGSNTRKAGCHQKAWKKYQREPKNRPESPISLVLLNIKKWISDENRLQDYCISVVFEHEEEIRFYNALRANVQTRTRVRRD